MPPLGAPPSVQLSCAQCRPADGGADVPRCCPPPAFADAATTYAVAPSGGAAAAVSEDVVLSVREPAADDGAPGALIFRAAFHTDFVPGGGVLRLNRAALDGASKKLHPDAFVDVIIAPPDDDEGGGGGAHGAAALWRAVDALSPKAPPPMARAGCARAPIDRSPPCSRRRGRGAARTTAAAMRRAPAPSPRRRLRFAAAAATPPPAPPPAAAAAAATAAAASADADAPAANASAAPAQAPEPAAEPPDLDAEIALVLAEGRIDGGVVGGGGVPLLDDELRELDEEFESLLDGE